MMKKLALCFSFLCLFTMPAFAAIDDAGAAKLKAMFENFIAFQKASINVNDDGRLQTDGEVSVEPSETFYAVTLPYMKIMTADDGRFEIGIISINAVPGDQDGEWKMTMALPTPMVMFDKDGEPLTRIAIGQQRAAGVWSEKLQNFYKLDASYQNVTAASEDDEYTLSLPAANIRYDFNFDTNALLSGVGEVSALNALIKHAEDNSALEVGEAKAIFEIDRFDTSFLEQYREQTIALAEHNSDATENSARMEAFYNLMHDLFLNSSNGFKSEYSAKNVKASGPEGKEVVSINSLNFGLDMLGFLEDAVDISLRAGAEELKPKFRKEEIEQTIPHSLKLDWQLQDIPVKQLADLVKNTAIAGIEQPNMVRIGLLSLMVKVPAIMAQAGTQLEIKDNYIAGPDFKITLDGLAKADLSAVNSMSVDATAHFEGLNILLQRLEKLNTSADDDDDNHENIQNAITQLKAIKNLGTPDDAASSNATYSFRFEVLPDGKILLNGKDFFMVMKEFGKGGEESEASEEDDEENTKPPAQPDQDEAAPEENPI